MVSGGLTEALTDIDQDVTSLGCRGSVESSWGWVVMSVIGGGVDVMIKKILSDSTGALRVVLGRSSRSIIERILETMIRLDGGWSS